MPRYPSQQQTPPAPTVEGDSFFDRVDMKNDRSTLPVGTLALSVNKRLRYKRADARKGTWLPVFANILDLTEIDGFGVYSNPNGQEVLLVAGRTGDTARAIYSMRDGTYPDTIPNDSPLADSVEFVQASDKVFLFQGTDTVQLVWDGVSSGGFKRIAKSSPADTSTSLIPPTVTAEHLANRLVLIKDKGGVLVSDILDYTSYDPILEVFRINSGGSNVDSPIVRVFNYAKGITLIFSARAINLLLNFTGDPDVASIELLNSQIGLAGRKAVVMLGGDVLFLSEPGGIYRVAQAFENRLQTIPLPITDPIQPLIDRINWTAASGAVSASLGEYVYFGVPIDGSVTNNCMIVYNGATGIVEGYDTWPQPFQIDDLAVTLYQGERHLFALDKSSARIYVLYTGKSDYIFDDPELRLSHEYPIGDVIETRGYATLGWNAATRRDFKKVSIGVATWAPALIITELTESVNDERSLTENPITKSRTQYDRFGIPDWIPTNENDDWATPGRQDYSIFPDETGFDPMSGIDPDRKQTSTLRSSTKARGKYISYRVANNQGNADIGWILVESTGTQREPRRAG